MVKGISRRVVVVKAPIGSIFDEAIFIMKDDTLSENSVDAEKILREACSVADEYVKQNCGKRRANKKVLFALSALLLLAVLLFLFLK